MPEPKPQAQAQAQAINWQAFFTKGLSHLAEAAKLDTEPRDMAEACRRVRDKLNISHKDLAKRIGTIPSHVYWMEQGKFGKTTETHLMAYSDLARSRGLAKTASFIAKWAGPTIMQSRKPAREY